MSKSKRFNKKSKTKVNKSRKNMKGGEFTPEEEETLRNQGFDDNEIARLIQLNIPMNIINQAITYYHENSHQLIINVAEGLNENANENGNENGNDNMDNENMAPLNLDDLQGDVVPDDNNGLANIPHNPDDNPDIDLDESGNTSFADDSFGGKRRTKRKRPKMRKHKSQRKMKGGVMFGNGYGANCNDPNYSIYNTNLLKLFPYNTK